MKKQTYKNRIAALLLAMLMTIGVLPAQVFAEGPESSGDVVIPETQITDISDLALAAADEALADTGLTTIYADIVDEEGNVISSAADRQAAEAAEKADYQPVETAPAQDAAEELPDQDVPTASAPAMLKAKAKGNKSDVLYANDDIYLTGKMPKNGIVEATPVTTEIDGRTVIAAYDIKIYNNAKQKAKGKTWQPAGEKVQVHIKTDALSGQTADVDIYHIADGSSPEFVTTVTPKDGAVDFEAESFSVYVITEHEGGEQQVARRIYHFIADLTDLNQPGPTYSADPYNFLNKGALDSNPDYNDNEYQTTQIILNGESLELIKNPEDRTATNQYFYGWYVVELVSDNTSWDSESKKYTGTIQYKWGEDPQRVTFNEAITFTAEELTAKKDVHIYVAPIYVNYHFVNFHELPKDSEDPTKPKLITRKLVALGDDNAAAVLVSDITAEAPDDVHLMFRGWEVYVNGVKMELIQNAQNPTVNGIQIVDRNGNGLDGNGVAKFGELGYIQTIDKTGAVISGDYYVVMSVFDKAGEAEGYDIDLYPFFDEVRWVYFNTGASGNGSVYVPSQVVLTGDNNKSFFASLPDTRRPGYRFDGWYAGDGLTLTNGDINTDAEGIVKVWDPALNGGNGDFTAAFKALTTVDSAKGGFYFSEEGHGLQVNKHYGDTYDSESQTWITGTTASSRLTLYAKWVATPDSEYYIYLWQQNANDDGYSLANYGLVKDQYAGQSTAIQSTTRVSINESTHIATLDSGTALSNYYTSEHFTIDGNIANKTITNTGDTIINVYYNRDIYTLKFYFARSYTYNNRLYIQVNNNNERFNNQAYTNADSLIMALTTNGYDDYSRSGGTNTWRDIANTQGSSINNAEQLVVGSYLTTAKSILGESNASIKVQTINTKTTVFTGTDGRADHNTAVDATVKINYYYIELKVKDGQSLASLWPDLKAFNLPQTTSQYNATGKTTQPRGDIFGETRGQVVNPLLWGDMGRGNATVKAVADSSLIQNESGKEGYYILYTRFESTHSALFEIYFSVLTGDSVDRTYNGVDYINQDGDPNTTRELTGIVASGYTDFNDIIAPSYEGFELVNEITDNITGNKTGKVPLLSGSGNTGTYNGTAYTGRFRAYYKRFEYPINIFPQLATGDSVKDGSGNDVSFNDPSVTVPYGEKLIYATTDLAEMAKYVDGETRRESSDGSLYVFSGWYDNPACTGVPYVFTESGGAYTQTSGATTTMPNQPINLYAKWTEITFRVQIDANGGVIDRIVTSGYNQDYYYNYVPGVQTGAGNVGDGYGVPTARSTNSLGYEYQYFFANFKYNDPNRSEYQAGVATYVNLSNDERLGQYNIARKYVPMSDLEAAAYTGTKYYYINTLYSSSHGPGIATAMRNAIFLTVPEDDTNADNNKELRRYFEHYVNSVHWSVVSLPESFTGMEDFVDTYAQDTNGNYLYLTQKDFYDNYINNPASTFAADFEAWKDKYIEKDADGNFQLYRGLKAGEDYQLLNWHIVESDDPSEIGNIFNFLNAPNHEVTIQAEWRLNGRYHVEYNTEYTVDGEKISGSINNWRDPAPEYEADGETPKVTTDYADNTYTVVREQPAAIKVNDSETITDDFIFRGWYVAASDTDMTPLEGHDANGKPTVFYDVGDDFLVRSVLSTDGVVHMQAYYEKTDASARRPYITNLVLDANTSQHGSTTGTLPSWIGVGASAIVDDHTIEFGDVQSSTALHLINYKDNFENTQKYFLIGFDEGSDPETLYNETTAPNGIRSGNLYIPTYAADATIAVQRNLNEKLYAIWEPMVYLTLKNQTGAAITVDLSGSESTALSVVNKVGDTYVYERSALTSTDISAVTVPANGEVKLVMPFGDGKLYSVKGTGRKDYQLNVANAPVDASMADPASATAFETESFEVKGKLALDENGAIVTFSETPVVHFHINGGTWNNSNDANIYRENGETHDQVVVVGDKATKPAYDPTQSGAKFVGWTLSSTAPALYVGEFNELQDYLDAGSPSGELYNFDTPVSGPMTLWAVWAKSETTITFMRNGGTWASTGTGGTSVSSGEGYQFVVPVLKSFSDESKTAPTVARTGKFKFMGWWVDGTPGETRPSASGVNKTELDKLTIIESWDHDLKLDKDMVLYAVWAKTVTVTFDISYDNSRNHNWTDTSGKYTGNTGNSTRNHTIVLVEGETVDKPSDPTTTRIYNAQFLYWVYNPSNQNSPYTSGNIRSQAKNPSDISGDNIYNFSTLVNADLTLTTSWTNANSVTFTVKKQVTGEMAEYDREFGFTYNITTWRYTIRQTRSGNWNNYTYNQSILESTQVGSTQVSGKFGLANNDEYQIKAYYWTTSLQGYTYPREAYLYYQIITVVENDNSNGYTLKSINKSGGDVIKDIDDRMVTFASAALRGNLGTTNTTGWENGTNYTVNSNTTVTYVNNRPAIAPTGYSTNARPFIMMLGLGAALYLLSDSQPKSRKRRRKKA